MPFLTPAWLWLLPLAALPFFLRRPTPPTRRIRVSALHLWPAPVAPPTAASKPRRIRVDRQAVCQAALLTLLIGALARPVLSRRGADLVLIVDVSASMAGPAGSVSRLDAGRRLLLAALGEHSGKRARVLEAGASTRDAGIMRVGGEALRAALLAMHPQATGADIESALAEAAVLEPDAPAWVVSDHAVPGAARTLSTGTPAGNLAVTALIARQRSGGDGITVMAQVGNFSTAAARARLVLVGDGQPLTEETITLPARGALVFTRSLAATAGIVEARLVTDQADGLAVDNTRVAVVEPRIRVTARLSGSEGTFFRKALEADGAVAIAERSATAADLTVCAGCPPEPLQPGGLLRIPAPHTAALPYARVTVSAPSHPLAAGLAGLTARAAPTGETPTANVILRAGTHPLVTATEGPEGRVVTLHADPADPGFASSALYAVLVANAVDWLAGSDNPLSITAGTPFRFWLGGSGKATLSGPDDRPRQAGMTAGWLSSRDTAAPGIYAVRSGDRTARFAVTPATDTESALDVASDANTPAREPAPARPRPGSEITRWLLVAALLALWLEWRAAGTPAARSGYILRAACASALVLAVAGLKIPFGSAPLTVVYAVDRSGSVPLRDQRAALTLAAAVLDSARGSDAAGLITFAGRAIVRQRPGQGRVAADFDAEPDPTGSNIAQALNAAVQLTPHDGSGRVVLVSDGHETDGHADQAARDAAGARVTIDVIPVGRRTPLPSVRVIQAPPDARAGEPFPIDVVLAGPAGQVVEVTLEVTEPGGPTPEVRRLMLASDGTAIARFTGRASEPGLVVYRAYAGPEPDTDGPSAAVTIFGPPRALRVVNPATPSRPLSVAVPGFAVTEVTADKLPVREADLARFELVLVDQVPGEALGHAAGAALTRYVEGGGGLVMLGSPESLPPGGYGEPQVDRLLPVDLRAAPGPRTAEAAVVVAVDKSGSMADTVGGLQKMEAARDAARRVSQVLGATAALGVVAFDLSASPVAPLSARLDAAALEDALAAVEPGGATRLAAGAEMAASWLGASGAARRHLLLVSDGRSSREDVERAAAVTGAAGVTVSVIAIGADADRAALTGLARRTGGRAYFPERLHDLARLAARDVVQSLGGATVTEPVALRAPAGHAVLRGLDPSTLPRLGGYVVTAPRPGAEPILESSLADPVLTARAAGLGRVMIFTGDLASPWSAHLRQWHGYAALFAQAFRWASRRETAAGLDAAIEESAGGARLAVRIEDEDMPGDMSAPRATLRGPDGRLEPLLLRPAGFGQFVAVIPDGPAGLYRVEVVTESAGEERRIVRGLLRPADRERLGQGVNEALLRRLAVTTGGRVLGDGENPFDQPRPAGFAPAAPWLTVAAAGLALAIVALGAVSRPMRQRSGADDGQVAA